jgi:hypothetical protein
MAGNPTVPGFIQVAADGVGKRMRTEVDSVIQPDGIAVDTHREIVSPPPEWTESAREKYMRQNAEDTLLTLNKILVVLIAMSGPTSPQGVSDLL